MDAVAELIVRRLADKVAVLGIVGLVGSNELRDIQNVAAKLAENGVSHVILNLNESRFEDCAYPSAAVVCVLKPLHQSHATTARVSIAGDFQALKRIEFDGMLQLRFVTVFLKEGDAIADAIAIYPGC